MQWFLQLYSSIILFTFSLSLWISSLVRSSKSFFVVVLAICSNWLKLEHSTQAFETLFMAQHVDMSFRIWFFRHHSINLYTIWSYKKSLVIFVGGLSAHGAIGQVLSLFLELQDDACCERQKFFFLLAWNGKFKSKFWELMAVRKSNQEKKPKLICIHVLYERPHFSHQLFRNKRSM